MNVLERALSWTGTNVELCLFGIWPVALPIPLLAPPKGTSPPEVVRHYTLEPDGDLLNGSALVHEYDLVFHQLPTDLDAVVAGWLQSATTQRAAVAWFALEGSFNYDHLLTADIADQVYGVADDMGVRLALDDRQRRGDGWLETLRLVRVRHRLP